jgi:hypothetical protein
MGGVCGVYVILNMKEKSQPDRLERGYFLIFFCLEVFLHITADPPKLPKLEASRHRDIERRESCRTGHA